MTTRRTDVDELIDEARTQFADLREIYEQSLRARSNEPRIAVKNLMENLRSVLDYLAQDIYETRCQNAAGALESTFHMAEPKNVSSRELISLFHNCRAHLRLFTIF